jgi:hypothetical protein
MLTFYLLLIVIIIVLISQIIEYYKYKKLEGRCRVYQTDDNKFVIEQYLILSRFSQYNEWNYKYTTDNYDDAVIKAEEFKKEYYDKKLKEQIDKQLDKKIDIAKKNATII